MGTQNFSSRFNGWWRIALTAIRCVVLVLAFVDGGANADVLLSQPLTVRWRYESTVTLNLTPAFDNERVYLPLAGGIIVALKAKDGQLFWRAEMGGELSASPVDRKSTRLNCSHTDISR